MMSSSGPGPRPGNVESAVPRARSASPAIRNPERTMFDNQAVWRQPDVISTGDAHEVTGRGARLLVTRFPPPFLPRHHRFPGRSTRYMRVRIFFFLICGDGRFSSRLLIFCSAATACKVRREGCGQVVATLQTHINNLTLQIIKRR